MASILMVLSGLAYRYISFQMGQVVNTLIKLPVPLEKIPLDVGNWLGRDVPISETVQSVAKNDDFLSRSYVNSQTGQTVSIYVAYSARPRTMLGHKPDVCYPNSGWIHDGTDDSSFSSPDRAQVNCLIHRFHSPSSAAMGTGGADLGIVVLNYYIVNGQITTSDSSFSGLSWRTPNIKGNPARYVAQVQISSILENAVFSAAGDFTDLIMDFLPDEDGRVRAAGAMEADR